MFIEHFYSVNVVSVCLQVITNGCETIKQIIVTWHICHHCHLPNVLYVIKTQYMLYMFTINSSSNCQYAINLHCAGIWQIYQ